MTERHEPADAGRLWQVRGMKERVEGLGGRYSVDSAPGRGTSVRITIPLAASRGGGRDIEAV